LQAHRPEIEQVALDRAYSLSDPTESDPMYLKGLRAALSAAIGHGLAVVERGEERSPPVPQALLSQARLAAQSGVSLDTVMRRYIAGNALLGDFLLREADNAELRGAQLQRVVRDLAAAFDSLLTSVTDEYMREARSRPSSTRERGEVRVHRLLKGELLDTSELPYDFDAWHLGALIAGPGAEKATRDLATALGRPYLLIRGGEGIIWAWLGGRRRIDPLELDPIASTSSPQTSLAVGEPARGLAGWRLTHRQARATLPIALRRPESVVHYADNALLASALQDDLLATSLREQYLVPLSGERDGGETFRATLRAYFSANRNISSAAATLRVSARTVRNRLCTVEERLGRPLSTFLPEIETALRLQDFDVHLGQCETITSRN
jgi:hypothetical protein